MFVFCGTMWFSVTHASLAHSLMTFVGPMKLSGEVVWLNPYFLGYINMIDGTFVKSHGQNQPREVNK